MAKKTKQEALKTYHALLDAAAELFSYQGISHTTLHDIASKAGMTRGAVYWHFKNKEDVIKALWDRDAAPIMQEFITKITAVSAAEPCNHFKNTIKEMIKQVTQNPKVSQTVRITLNSTEITTHQTELQSYLEDKSFIFYQAFVVALSNLGSQNLLKSTHSPEFLAGALWSYLHGLVDINMNTHIMKIDLKNNSDQLIDLFLDGYFHAE
ncbi:TetR family transcriptional regulator [Neptunomonas antarctica]|uniref:Transcriptional regulator, TetR family n=1 Tax=Neptunomonas antarctica TaxID=619304 RepID=A0A1N7KXU8_9GAMM|nr:TetR family transcriptional regulator [Neptunomonas antarctica]SIS66367.1 transcriptional regulator, TetR family [Neptunomonas antarctica]